MLRCECAGLDLGIRGQRDQDGDRTIASRRTGFEGRGEVVGGITTPRTESGKGLMEKSRISSLLSDRIHKRCAHKAHSNDIHICANILLRQETTSQQNTPNN